MSFHAYFHSFLDVNGAVSVTGTDAVVTVDVGTAIEADVAGGVGVATAVASGGCGFGDVIVTAVIEIEVAAAAEDAAVTAPLPPPVLPPPPPPPPTE